MCPAFNAFASVTFEGLYIAHLLYLQKHSYKTRDVHMLHIYYSYVLYTVCAEEFLLGIASLIYIQMCVYYMYKTTRWC